MENAMAADSTTNHPEDARIVQQLENVYRQIQRAATEVATPERSGLLNSLEVMLAPSVRAARLLVDDDVMRVAD
jgi:hypothetical protein